MTEAAFNTARQAMETIQWYRGCYGSTAQFQERFREILGLLRQKAERSQGGGGEKNFLLAFADALEVANISQPYRPLSERE